MWPSPWSLTKLLSLVVTIDIGSRVMLSAAEDVGERAAGLEKSQTTDHSGRATS
jgi:hypothetical protein